MYLDPNRYSRQLESVNKWINNKGIGTLHLVQGFGKTFIGLFAIDLMNKKNSSIKNTLIICPSVIDKENWEAVYHDLYSEGYINNVGKLTIVTIDKLMESVLTIIPTEYDLIIYNEIHKYTSENRHTIFTGERFISKYKLGLTGTLPDGKSELGNYINTFLPVIDAISEEEAIRNNWISQFLEFNIALKFPPELEEPYRKLSIPIRVGLNHFRNVYKMFRDPQTGLYIFNNDYDLIDAAYHGKTIKGYYVHGSHIRDGIAQRMGWTKDLDISTDYGRDRNANWNPNNIYDLVKVFHESIKARNELLIDNEVKLSTVVDLFERFPGPTICFNESTKFADKIAARINLTFADIGRPIAISYHSNSRGFIIDPETGDYFRHGVKSKHEGEPILFGKDRTRALAVDGMRNGVYYFLATARALDEALDIPNIEQIITTAGTANPIQYQQRKGRGIRVDVYNPNKVTRIFNLYFDDIYLRNDDTGQYDKVTSRDKTKLMIRQKDNGSRIIWIKDIKDIEYYL